MASILKDTAPHRAQSMWCITNTGQGAHRLTLKPPGVGASDADRARKLGPDWDRSDTADLTLLEMRLAVRGGAPIKALPALALGRAGYSMLEAFAVPAASLASAPLHDATSEKHNQSRRRVQKDMGSHRFRQREFLHLQPRT